MADEFKITIEDFKNYEKQNQDLIHKHIEYQVSIFENYFDIQQKLFYKHMRALFAIAIKIPDSEQISLQCFHKSINLLYVAHNTILLGHHGAAKSILRQILEFLVFGKFFFIKKNDRIVKNWVNETHINITNQVFHQFDKSGPNTLYNFWKELSIYTHATKSANQLNTHFNVNLGDIEQVYAILLILLRCNYHLLSSCIVNKKTLSIIKDYNKDQEEIPLIRKRAKYLNSEINKELTKIGRDTIKAYITKWEIK